jgi:cystathionine beta-lyase family protein involved in aluminum resistance
MSAAPDLETIARKASDEMVKLVLIQRSRGYTQRPALTVGRIAEIIRCVKAVNQKAAVGCGQLLGELWGILNPRRSAPISRRAS